MKRLLLVLLVLGLSVPAIADVFVYNKKNSGVEFEYYGDSWTQSNPSSDSGQYLIIEPNYNDNTVNILEADTWKEKDEGGVTHKYYEAYEIGTLAFLQTRIGSKQMWIISGNGTGDSNNTRIIISGQPKSTKIGTDTYTVAATLNGYAIWGAIVDEDLGGGSMSLKLNSTITKELVSSDADVISAISAYFEEVLGYEPY
jgi:hypothetical protein